MSSGVSHRLPHAAVTVAVRGNDALARELALPIAGDDAACDLVLTWTDGALELRDLREPRLNPLRVDFSDAELRPYAAGLSRRQPLARAIGKHQLVADACAGLGQDALRLALMGFRVTAIERSRVVAALLADGLRRLDQQHALHGRLRLLTGDARELLGTLQPRPEVVYLDPMFPEKRRRTAAVRKELKWLRELVGDDPDVLELFDAARRTATHRVVVKRPDHAPPLVPQPAASIAGKLVRYDIYSTRI
jgi:16S rRNA (guanine1516-N2)-methyltransferase